jgi:hypothetical protein
MVAINPEMLRELLEEFTEKEEVTREEMNAINQQIAELEKRIESSKVKLAGLNKDREKIDLMRERYLSGNWKLQLSNMSAAASSSPATPTAEPAAAPQPAAASPAPTPASSSHAEGRAARRAAREAASQPAASDSNAASVETSGSTTTPAEAPVAESVAAPISSRAPVAAPEPEAPPVPEPVVEAAPVVEVAPAATFAPEPEPEPVMPEAPPADAPTFSSVAQFEAAQAESSIEHAPPDDPIMSSFSSAPSNAPDINAALASSSQSQEAPVVEPENSGFSWSSTAINALPASGQDNSASQSPAESAPMPAFPMPNPWGSSESDASQSQPAVEQRQSAADIWGHPAATPQAAPAAQQAEGAWGDFGEDWQMKEAEAQRAAANNAPVPPPPPPAPASEGGWGQTGGGSPWSSPATAQPAPADLPPAGGGWGQPTASRQGMPAMQAPTSFPVASPPAPDAAAASNPAADAWGRSGQASSSGWATQGSPWGDPAGQAQPPAPAAAPANPFSQPQASQQPAQLPGTPMPAPEQGAGGDESRSSLARAADGALISPVKGRRRGAGTPAAFDWGSPDSSSSGNAGDPNQPGGSEDSGDNKKIDDVLKGLFK